MSDDDKIRGWPLVLTWFGVIAGGWAVGYGVAWLIWKVFEVML